MKKQPKRPQRHRPDRHQFVRQQFVRDVHEWLALGYEQLNPSEFAQAQEEHITGELVAAMKHLLICPDAPTWVDYLSVWENSPQNHTGKCGNERPRVDIEFEKVGPGVRPRFSIEAKRLYRGDSIAEYLNSVTLVVTNKRGQAEARSPRSVHQVREQAPQPTTPHRAASHNQGDAVLGRRGLGCFLSGEYAAAQDAGGMVGYVQNDNAETWVTKITDKMARQPAAYQLCHGGAWQAVALTERLQATYRTQHDRQGAERWLAIYHTLLRFY